MTVKKLREALRAAEITIPSDVTNKDDLTALYEIEIGPILKEEKPEPKPEPKPAKAEKAPEPEIVFPPHDEERYLLSPKDYYERQCKASGQKLPVVQGKMTIEEYHAQKTNPAE